MAQWKNYYSGKTDMKRLRASNSGIFSYSIRLCDLHLMTIRRIKRPYFTVIQ